VAQPAEAPRKITAAEKEFKAFRTLRVARANQRHEGVRKARAAKVSTNVGVGLTIFLTSCFSDLDRKRRRKPQRRSKFVFVVLTFSFPSCSYPLTSEAANIALYAYATNMNVLDSEKTTLVVPNLLQSALSFRGRISSTFQVGLMKYSPTISRFWTQAHEF